MSRVEREAFVETVRPTEDPAAQGMTGDDARNYMIQQGGV